jgi:hypothetical protein
MLLAPKPHLHFQIMMALSLAAPLGISACSGTEPLPWEGTGGTAGSAGASQQAGAATAGSSTLTAGLGGMAQAAGAAASGHGGAGGVGDIGGAGGRVESGGSAGSADATAGSATGGTTTTGGGGANGGSGALGCAAGKYLLCEDFEATAVGEVPAGWTKQGNAGVSEANAAGGKRSLAITAAANGSRRMRHPGAILGSQHWGRIRYKVQLPVPDAFVHSTLVALQGNGPTRGAEEVRVVDTVKNSSGNGSKHQFLYNVQASNGEFGKGSSYDYAFDGAWHCAEWHLDAATQTYEFFFEGTRLSSISFTNGAGKYTGSEIPTSIDEIRVGWNNYQSAPPGFTAWIDDVALDVARVGCD